MSPAEQAGNYVIHDGDKLCRGSHGLCKYKGHVMLGQGRVQIYALKSQNLNNIVDGMFSKWK